MQNKQLWADSLNHAIKLTWLNVVHTVKLRSLIGKAIKNSRRKRQQTRKRTKNKK